MIMKTTRKQNFFTAAFVGALVLTNAQAKDEKLTLQLGLPAALLGAGAHVEGQLASLP
jgi:hypothetical protein